MAQACSKYSTQSTGPDQQLIRNAQFQPLIVDIREKADHAGVKGVREATSGHVSAVIHRDAVSIRHLRAAKRRRVHCVANDDLRRVRRKKLGYQQAVIVNIFRDRNAVGTIRHPYIQRDEGVSRGLCKRVEDANQTRIPSAMPN